MSGDILHDLQGLLFKTADRFIDHCAEQIGIGPANPDFTAEFADILSGS